MQLGASNNTIGTNGDFTGDEYEGNLIAGFGSVNRGAVAIEGAGTDFNVVAGNFLGTNKAGTAIRSNSIACRSLKARNRTASAALARAQWNET